MKIYDDGPLVTGLHNEIQALTERAEAAEAKLAKVRERCRRELNRYLNEDGDAAFVAYQKGRREVARGVLTALDGGDDGPE